MPGRKSILWKIALMPAFLLITMLACGTSAGDSNGGNDDPPPPPPASNTPVPSNTPLPTDTPEPTVVPTATQIASVDDSNDGIDCATGEPSTTPLPADVDVTNAYVEIGMDGLYFDFFIEFGNIEIFTEQVFGGVEIFDPKQPLLTPPDTFWLFNNVANFSYNFDLTPPTSMDTYMAAVGPNGWEEMPSPFMGTVDGNTINLMVPIAEVPVGAFWGLALTDQFFTVCEAVGYGDELHPMLPFPPVE